MEVIADFRNSAGESSDIFWATFDIQGNRVLPMCYLLAVWLFF
jgi:hypothetical protein